MPRIRKKTSNRGSTNERKKILHKVRESRKKKVKAAKKNPQWKSKHKKDPGIPNNFPYKDQILAEVAEQRRLTAEEKQKRKEQKKPPKKKSGDELEEGSEEEALEQEKPSKSLDVGLDGIASLSARRLLHARANKRPALASMEVDEEEEVPILINHDLPTLQSVLDESDVVIQVLDARDPLSFRSSHIEKLVAEKPGKRMLLILSKIDTCPREALVSWATYLRSQHPTFLFRSATSCLPEAPEILSKSKGKSKALSSDGLGTGTVLECLSQWAKEKRNKESLVVSVVGITNSGKSSFVNSLLGKSAMPIYKLASSSRGPTTTILPHEVILEASGRQIRIIDTPGLIWDTDPTVEGLDDIRARDILIRSKGRIDRLKDPGLAVSHIVARSNNEDLMLLYSLPAFAKGDPESFLAGISRSHHLVKKRGELDLASASRIVLRDWSTGKFPRYTIPPNDVSSQVTQPDLQVIYAKEIAILAVHPTKKEMRKSGGLVKFISSEIEQRAPILVEPWSNLKDGNTSSDEDEDEDEEEDVNEEGDPPTVVEESDDIAESPAPSEEESQKGDPEDESPPPMPKTQKRKRPQDSKLVPSKKVTFAPEPKSSKQARAAGSMARGLKAPKPTPPAPAKIRQSLTKKSAMTPATTTKASTMSPGGNSEAYDFSKFF
ncbi:hypothetical protein BD779DRAFT_353539 [Infundibulicybe gibba]|nr:hypothetical protein BD779DRAFT_353539 [Infundibulicybe gibba]